MTYAVQQDLIDRFGDAELKQLADRDGDDVLDAEIIADALTDAGELIDTYVGAKYSLPLSSTPPLLTSLAADIARYLLYKDSATEQVTKRYDDAVKLLKDISKGTAALDVGGTEPAPAGDSVEHSGPERIFTRTTLADY